MYEYRFAGARKGVSKTTGQPYHVVELHDPKSYKNGNFNAEFNIETESLKPGDKVKVEFDIEFNAWRNQIRITKIEKVT